MGHVLNFRNVKLTGKAQALKSLEAKQIFSRTNMKISSPTKNLKMETVDDLRVKTAIGKIHLQSLKDMAFEAKNVSVIV